MKYDFMRIKKANGRHTHPRRTAKTSTIIGMLESAAGIILMK